MSRGGDTPQDRPLENDLIRECFETANDAIFVHDGENGEIIDVNRTACDMYGYSREQLMQSSLGHLSAGNAPYTQANAIERIRDAAQGTPQRFE